MIEIFAALAAALVEPDPVAKCAAVQKLYAAGRAGKLRREPGAALIPIAATGRPLQPRLVDPRQLPRRSFASDVGRIHMLHAVAHIEFNAINIALDAAYRFRQLPAQYADDWLAVAADEARHFRLLSAELDARGSFYGACDAHGGLWDMVVRTCADPLHRMAMVPRVMEARGLDVTPGMIAKFGQYADTAAVAILEVIYRDEIGHVRIGNHWFEWLCRERGLQPAETFRELVQKYMGGNLRGPFNREGRIEAGFDAAEIDALDP